MAKTQEKTSTIAVSKEMKNKKGKEAKAPKEKNGNALVGRVKKVIKKSRRKMGEEKFEKELQRTIAFLEELRLKLDHAPTSRPEKTEKGRKKAADKKAVAKTNTGNGQIKAKSKARSNPKPDPNPSVSPAAPLDEASAGK